MKRLLYMWKMRRTFRDEENREVAMLLYDHLGVKVGVKMGRVVPMKASTLERLGRWSFVGRFLTWLKSWVDWYKYGYFMDELALFKDGECVGVLGVMVDTPADEVFRERGWSRLSRKASLYGFGTEAQAQWGFDIPKFRSAAELRMKFALKGGVRG